jgi:uncharacterized protein YybS (DUF2232 family)
MPELSLPQAIVIVGVIFAALIYVIARAWFER